MYASYYTYLSLIPILSFTCSNLNRKSGKNALEIYPSRHVHSSSLSFHQKTTQLLITNGLGESKNDCHDSNRKIVEIADTNPEKKSKDLILRCAPSASAVTNRKLNVYLLTFPQLYPFDEKQTNKKDAKHMKQLKRWKYYALGDGGVYFDQRPNTLIALNGLILDRIKNELLSNMFDQYYTYHQCDNDEEKICDNDIKLNIECAVISTCRRFEILLTVEIIEERKTKIIGYKSQIKNIVASCIAEQIICQRRKLQLQEILPFLALPLDRPSRIKYKSQEQLSAATLMPSRLRNIYDGLKGNIEAEIEVFSGVHDVASRLINMSSGLLERSLFRPFSSRDAHIMAQIKRSANGSLRQSCSYVREKNNGEETVQQINHGYYNDKNTTKYIKILFDSALQGGKATRSPKVVPILYQLRKESNGADGPPKLSAEAARSAEILAIEPTLNACIEKFKSLEFSDSINTLRSDARRIAKQNGIDLDRDDGKAIRSILHQPTIDLRRGQSINKAELLEQIKLEIELAKNVSYLND